MGLEIEGINREFEGNLEEFGRAALEIIDLGCGKIVKIRASQNEIFFIGTWSEKILTKFDKSKKLQISIINKIKTPTSLKSLILKIHWKT